MAPRLRWTTGVATSSVRSETGPISIAAAIRPRWVGCQRVVNGFAITASDMSGRGQAIGGRHHATRGERSGAARLRPLLGWLAWFAGLIATGVLTLVLLADANAARGRLEQAQWWRTHTLAVLIDAERLDTALNRALLATGHPAAPNGAGDGLDGYRELSGELGRLTRDNSSQQRRLAELDRRVLAFTSSSAAASARPGETGAALAGQRRLALNSAETVLATFKAEEHRLLRIREARTADHVARSRRFERVLLWLDGVLLMVIAGVVAAMLRAQGTAARTAAKVAENERLYRLLADNATDVVLRTADPGAVRCI